MAREAFFIAHASSIPDDLCLAISNAPQTFSIISESTSGHDDDDQHHDPSRESLPTIPEDLLIDVCAFPF